MASTFETVLYEKRGAVAYVTLNRPARLNSYNIQMRDDLYQVWSAVRDDPDVRVAILAGAGDRAFCAGADLSEFGTAPSPVVARQVRFERPVWELWLSLPQVLIAAIHGHCLGSGIEMALCCDLRLASDDAQFGLPEVSLGLIAAAGGTQTVPRALGYSAGLDLLLTGRRIDAREAHRIGLVNRVVPRPDLLPQAEALAARVLAMAPRAVAAIKQAVREGMDLPLPQALEMERRLSRRVLSSRDAREGIAAWREGRPSVFTGE
jgi:enoyl-CoA hydratase